MESFTTGPNTSPFKLSCLACHIVASLILSLDPGKSRDDIKNAGIGLCVSFLAQSEKMCRGIIEGNVDVLLDLKSQGIPLTAEKICGTVLENSNCAIKNGPQVEWSVETDLGRKLNNTILPSEFRTNEEVSIIQITDIHYDPGYFMGRTASCSEPLCCRSDQPLALTIADNATRYGHYNYCDMPLDVVRSCLENIVKKHKNISMVYMTGDIIAHAVWETSREQNENTIKVVGNMFREYFKDIPIIPIVGNHETHPVNVFAPYFIEGNSSTNWLYKSFIDIWGWSLPNEAKKTFLKGGYYTFLADKNLRIIVLNTNIYQKLNWWNIIYPVDMNDQLSWLSETLLEAEKANEKVHILSHIPPGSEDTLLVFQREYRKIIDRFEHTITAEFNGHTHFEDFKLFYDKENASRPIRAAFNGGSITSYFNVNPNYRLYKFDKGTWELNDFESYSYNISTVENDSPPEWKKLYSFKQDYGLKSMKPDELGNFLFKMMDDEQLFEKYFYNYLKGSNKEVYDDQRKLQILCSIMTTDVSDQTHCDILKQVHKSRPKRSRKMKSIAEKFKRELSKK